MFFTEGQLKIFGRQIGERLMPGAVVALIGELGTGKTTMAKAIAEGLGVIELVTSPTFTLMNEYFSGRLPFYHIDIYRLIEKENHSFNSKDICSAHQSNGLCKKQNTTIQSNREIGLAVETLEIDLEEYIYNCGVTVIEWADFIEEMLPEHTLRIELCYTNDPGIRQIAERNGALSTSIITERLSE